MWMMGYLQDYFKLWQRTREAIILITTKTFVYWRMGALLGIYTELMHHEEEPYQTYGSVKLATFFSEIAEA